MIKKIEKLNFPYWKDFINKINEVIEMVNYLLSEDCGKKIKEKQNENR